jgi:hypothetical protein
MGRQTKKEDPLNGTKKGRTAKTRIRWILLLAGFSVLTLGGCEGGGDDGKVKEKEGGGETTAALEAGTTVAGGRTTTPELAVTTVELTTSRNSGTSATANLTDTPGGVEVALAVRGLPTYPGTEHIADIHEGVTCYDERAGSSAPVLYGLDPLYTGQDGTAASATSIQGVTLDDLTLGTPKYIDIHTVATDEEAVSPSIACGDLPATRGEETAGG